MTKPRVSVVIPTHNRPQLLAAALASLGEQTIVNWEAIVVDDASAPPVACGLGDARIRVVRVEPGKGGAAAKNRGIRETCGEVIAYLDDDDLYAPTYLERALLALDLHPEIDLVYMGVAWFGSNGAWGQDNYDRAMERFLATVGGVQEGELILFDAALLHALVKSVPMAFQRPVVRRATLDRIGGYRADALLWDCDWAIRAALESRAALIHTGLYLQRAEGQGYSSKPGRVIEHLQSGIDIMETLWAESRAGRHPQHAALFRRAAAAGWFNLAWHHYTHGRRGKSLRPLWRSARIGSGLPHLKLLARLALPRRKGTPA